MTLVSVITPYYKKKNYFKKYFKSIQKQTYSKLEIIIIYDDKDKEELKFIRQIIKFDKRFKIIVNQKKLGAGKSRNRGILKAKGKYIAFLDADDYWSPKKVELQIDEMKKKNFLVSHTSYKIINENNKVLGHRLARDFDDVYDLLKSCDIGCSTVMMKKIVFDKNCKFAEIKTKEDFVFWLSILSKNININAIKKELSFWRKSNKNLSSSSIQKIKDGYLVYYKYMNFNFLKSLYYLSILSLNFLLKTIKNK